jgi:hypothetical protein
MHYRFQFTPPVDLNEAEATLRLAVMACEGLFGEARTRMEVSYSLDAGASAITVDGRTAPGEAVIRIFASYLSREFGRDAFVISRHDEPAAEPVTAGDAA